jgi:hypothetical protein
VRKTYKLFFLVIHGIREILNELPVLKFNEKNGKILNYKIILLNDKKKIFKKKEWPLNTYNSLPSITTAIARFNFSANTTCDV